VERNAVARDERGRSRIESVDVLIALAVAVVTVGGTFLAKQHQTDVERNWDAGAVALLLAAAVAVAFRRRAPVAMLALAFAATLAYQVVGYPGGPIWAALIITFFTAVLYGYRRTARLSLLLGFLAFLWVKPLLDRGPGPSVASVLGLLAWLLLLLAAAEGWRNRAQRAAETERMREEEARRRASEERVLIAREVHDVVAHNMSLINVQAATALHLFDEHPEQARAALATIKDASKQALVELRSVLGVLRRVDEAVPLAPTPGADQLDELVTRSTAAGLAVHIVTEGTQRPLPPAVDLAVYRIVQEALTNVARHAGGADATVRIEYGEHDVVVEIDDDGGRAPVTTPAHVGSGNGIAGMHERATLLGGTLYAGPGPQHGFRVRAWFPTEAAE
jgi:signal transduction histidine kinase